MNAAEVDSEHSNPSLRSRDRTGVVSPRPESLAYTSPDDGESPSVWSPEVPRRSPAPDNSANYRTRRNNGDNNAQRVVSSNPWMEVNYRNIRDDTCATPVGGWSQVSPIPHYASPLARRRRDIPRGPSNGRYNGNGTSTPTHHRREPPRVNSPRHEVRPVSYTTNPDPLGGTGAIPTGVRTSAPSGATLLDWLSQQSIGNDYLLRRILEERDSIRDEYATVMSERDNVHRELETLQTELTEAKRSVESLSEIANNKTSENERLRSDVGVARNLFNSMCLSLMELRNNLVQHLTNNELSPQPFPTSTIVLSIFEQYLLDNSLLNESRNWTSMDRQRHLNRGAMTSSFSSSEDEHEQHLPGSLERSIRAPSSNFSQSPPTSVPGYSSVTLLIEEIGNLRSQLDQQATEFEQIQLENESLKRNLRGRESENSSLLLQIERQKREFQKLKDSNNEKVITIVAVKEPLFECGVKCKEKTTLSFLFPEDVQFCWSRFGVSFTNITGRLTVSDVKPSSLLREFIRPKYELSKALKKDAKTSRELDSLLSGKRSKFDFEFLAKFNSIGSQHPKKNIREVWTQTPPIEQESSITEISGEEMIRPQNPSCQSPFTRNSTLRSPLGKISNDNRGQAIGRNRHRSYSPSMDLNVKYFDTTGTSPQVFDIKPKRSTIPKQSTSFVSHQNSATMGASSSGSGTRFRSDVINDPEVYEGLKVAIEKERFYDRRPVCEVEPALSEENLDEMFNFSVGNEDITTEPVTAEDFETTNCSVLETSTETGSFRLHPQMHVNKTNFHTNLLLTPDSVAVSINAPTNVLKVSHKQTSSEPYPPNEESKQSNPAADPDAKEKTPVCKMSTASDKPPISKTPRRTWPRMHRALNFGNQDDETLNVPADEYATSVGGSNTQSGNELSQESVKSKSVTKKRPNILSFKFSPVASLRSKSSSKSSNTSKVTRNSKASSTSSGTKTSSPKTSIEGPVIKKDSDPRFLTEVLAITSPDYTFNSERTSSRDQRGGNVYDETQTKSLPSRKRDFLHSRGQESDVLNVGSVENLCQKSERSAGQLERPRTVTMRRSGDEHLGISVAEIGGNIMVQRVRPRSLASSSGIKVGDQILEFNGVNFRGASYNHARAVLTSSSTDVTMLLDHVPSNLSGAERKMDSKTGKEEKVASNEEDRTNSEVASVRRVVIKRKENSSSFWGFSFCGGNTNGLFVSKVMPNLSDLLAEGDKILQVNGIPLDGATFEEFFIYLKCYAQTYLTIEVEACPDLFRIAADMNERDNFCIRSLKSSKLLQQQLLAPGDNNNGLYLEFEAGDILCVTDSLYRGYFGHWLAQVANPNPTRVNSGLFHEPCTSGASYDDKLKVSGLIPSCYLNLGDIQNQLSQSFKNQSDISKTNTDDNEEERRSSFRKFVSKISLFTSGHSHSKSNAYFSSNEEEPLNIQSCSFFEYVKPFNNEGFQRPVLFVGVYADLFVQYLAGHVTAHFKLFDQSATDYFKQSSLEAENWLEASSYSVRSSVTKYEMKALRKLCSTCAKGVHPILAGDLLKLKVLIDNELQPLVFFFDPKLSPKTLRDVYTSLKNDGNLSSKMVKNLLDYGERTKRDLKKLKYFCVSLRGPLVMAIKELMKQLEPRSPFVTFAASAPSQLGLEVAKLAVH